MLLVAFLGLLHALIDATTVSVIFRATRVTDITLETAFWLVVGYDIIAFASQVLFGWMTDRWASPKTATLLGLGLAMASMAFYRTNPVAAMVLTGIGNSLFHLGAGAMVLRRGLDRALPSGLFVAPGALGLGFGIFYGKAPQLGPLWPLAAIMLVVLVVTSLIHQPAAPVQASPASRVEASAGRIALALLLASIAIRSLVGLSSARGCPKTSLLLIGIPLAGFLGKSFGGLVADRFGWVESSVVALAISAPMIVFGYRSPLILLAGLVAFQMTMPVTLLAVARLFPTRLATGFGFTCLALIAGALPTMFPWGNSICGRGMLLAWIVLAIGAVFFGLRQLGLRRSYQRADNIRSDLALR
jgi:FSR family fosmidomycin resistance protein-like MFS transporter